MPKKKIAGREIIRPLVETKRQDIESFLKRKKIKPRIDPSNAQDIYFRNKIRNRLLPLLAREYNKNIKEVLANTAKSLACDYDYLHRLSEQTAKRWKHRLYIKKLSRAHPALQRLILRQAYRRIRGDMRRITFKHIAEIEDLILNRPMGSIVDLPRGVSVVKKKSRLIFYKR